MTAVTIPDGTNINGVPVNGGAEAETEIQVKGFLTSDYKVQTQYDVTLYEWDVYVNGRADLMAWDVFLNLGVRADQSAYHEFFLPLQVEFGQPFTMDEFNFLASFDTGNINPFSHQIGLSLQDITISVPYWEPMEEEEDPVVEEPSSEPSEEPEPEDTAAPEIPESLGENSAEADDQNISEPIKSGCSAIDDKFSPLAFVFTLLLIIFRKEE